jgi:hypothetical protein
MSDFSEFKSFEEFWPFYVHEHSNKFNRMLHFAGTSLALTALGYAIAKRKPKALLLAPLAGYGFAWVGHFLVEKNRPATFKHPLWSLRGDFRMFRKILDGTMDEEVRRVMQDAAASADGAGSQATATPDPKASSTTSAPAPRSSTPGTLN